MLTDMLADKGFVDAIVTPRSEPISRSSGPRRLKVTFTIVDGRRSIGSSSAFAADGTLFRMKWSANRRHSRSSKLERTGWEVTHGSAVQRPQIQRAPVSADPAAGRRDRYHPRPGGRREHAALRHRQCHIFQGAAVS